MIKDFDVAIVTIDDRHIVIRNLPALNYKELTDHILDTHEGIKSILVKECNGPAE